MAKNWTVTSKLGRSGVADNAATDRNVDQAITEGRRRTDKGATDIAVTAPDGSSYTRR